MVGWHDDGAVSKGGGADVNSGDFMETTRASLHPFGSVPISVGDRGEDDRQRRDCISGRYARLIRELRVRRERDFETHFRPVRETGHSTHDIQTS